MAHRPMVAVLGWLTAVLAGCGGGGGGGGGGFAGNLNSAPGDAAFSAWLQASHQATLRATDGSGNNWTIQASHAPIAGTTTFNSVGPAYSAVQTVSISVNGTPQGGSASTIYFLLNPFVPLGGVGNGGIPYAVVTSSTPIPATLTVGASGSFDNLTYYHDATMATLDAYETTTYTVSANNSTTLLYCLQSVFSGVTAQGGADGLGDGSETDCYSVDAQGNAALVSITVTVLGVTLNFR